MGESKLFTNTKLNNMNEDFFTLNSREEVIRFVELLENHEKNRVQIVHNYFPLVKAYDYLKIKNNSMRSFTSILDIYINFTILKHDSMKIMGVWNDFFSKDKLEGGSILDSQVKFSAKMDIHQASSSYILRYRSLWDKIMGFLILFFVPNEYENFAGAKSRKTAFRKIVEKNQLSTKINTIFNRPYIEVLDEITRFDEIYRTPEAHGAGALRKWSLSMQSMLENPSGDLIGYWNVINQIIANIGNLFDNEDENIKIDT